MHIGNMLYDLLLVNQCNVRENSDSCLYGGCQVRIQIEYKG